MKIQLHSRRLPVVEFVLGVAPLLVPSAAAAQAPAIDWTTGWTVVRLQPDSSVAPSFLHTYGRGVSGDLQVGESALNSYDNGSPRATLWRGATGTNIDLHPAWARRSYATSVDGNVIAGWAYDQSLSVATPLLWHWDGQAATVTDLSPPQPPPGTPSYVYRAYGGVLYGTRGGQQVGYSPISPPRYVGAWTGNYDAMLWLGTAASWRSLHPTQVSNAINSIAFATDGHRQVGRVTVLVSPFLARDHAALWSGTAGSFVDIHPVHAVAATESKALDVHGSTIGGSVMESGIWRAALWDETQGFADYVDLNPLHATRGDVNAVSDGVQVGSVSFVSYRNASFWAGSAASWVDLHAWLPAHFTGSEAFDVWRDGLRTIVVGMAGTSGSPGIAEAVLWVHEAGPRDSDADGLEDADEAAIHGTDPHDADTDDDALLDGAEVATYGTDPLDADTDDDGLLDGHEVALASLAGCPSPLVADSDMDGVGDHDEVLWMLDPCDVDLDDDGLVDGLELSLGTNPAHPDSDGDGLLDGAEVDVAQATGCPDPLDADTDADGVLDGAEALDGTNPCNPDSDGDGVPDDLDPTPTVPGVTTTFLEAAARDARESILSISVDEFFRPSPNVGLARRNALANQANDAANALAAGDTPTALLILQGMLAKIDDLSPPPDWMESSPQKSALADDVRLLIALLAY